MFAPSQPHSTSITLEPWLLWLQLDFIAEITRQLNEQVVAYMTKLATLDTLRQQLFPTSTDFKTAIDQIFDPIQTAIGG